MLPDLRQTTLALIQEAERISGYPVEVHADPSMSLPAALAMARGQTPFNVITFNPRVVGAPDYVVCVQCAFIIRHFAPKPDGRVDLGPSERGRKSTGELVRRMIQQGRMPLPVEQATTFAARLLDGLGTQLRSIPVQLRIDDWLGREHLELRDAQVTDVRRQLLNDEQALKAQGQVPAKIVRASLSMNAATALYWAGILADDSIAAPYRQRGFSMAGRSLLRVWYRIDAQPSSDRMLIDAWAHERHCRLVRLGAIRRSCPIRCAHRWLGCLTRAGLSHSATSRPRWATRCDQTTLNERFAGWVGT